MDEFILITENSGKGLGVNTDLNLIFGLRIISFSIVVDLLTYEINALIFPWSRILACIT